jgi:hypothetical protein
MELKHRGSVRYGQPHLPDYWADHRFGAQWLAPVGSGLWVAASLLPLLLHVDNHGAITGPFRLESPSDSSEICGVIVDTDEQVWIHWPGGISHFDPATLKQGALKQSAHGLALGEGALWTVDYEGQLIRIDSTTLEPKALGAVGRSIFGLAVSQGVVWVMSWDAELQRTIVVGSDPADGAILGSTVVAGNAQQPLLAHPDGVVVRVWRPFVDGQPHFDDTLIWLDAEGEVKRELVIEPTGVSAAVRGEEVWLSGLDPFDHGSFGGPSVIRRLRHDGTEQSFAVDGTVDQLIAGSTAVWGRLDERYAPWRAGSVVEVTLEGEVRTTDLSGVEIADHLPPPPPAIDAQEQEERARTCIADALFGGGLVTDPDTGQQHRVPAIHGVTIEDVRLQGSFPETEIVVLFRADARPSVLFGRRRRVWEDSGELSDVVSVMDVNLTEDITACRYGLPADPEVDPSGISWF